MPGSSQCFEGWPAARSPPKILYLQKLTLTASAPISPNRRRRTNSGTKPLRIGPLGSRTGVSLPDLGLFPKRVHDLLKSIKELTDVKTIHYRMVGLDR